MEEYLNQLKLLTDVVALEKDLDAEKARSIVNIFVFNDSIDPRLQAFLKDNCYKELQNGTIESFKQVLKDQLNAVKAITPSQDPAFAQADAKKAEDHINDLDKALASGTVGKLEVFEQIVKGFASEFNFVGEEGVSYRGEKEITADELETLEQVVKKLGGTVAAVDNANSLDELVVTLDNKEIRLPVTYAAKDLGSKSR